MLIEEPSEEQFPGTPVLRPLQGLMDSCPLRGGGSEPRYPTMGLWDSQRDLLKAFTIRFRFAPSESQRSGRKRNAVETGEWPLASRSSQPGSTSMTRSCRGFGMRGCRAARKSGGNTRLRAHAFSPRACNSEGGSEKPHVFPGHHVHHPQLTAKGNRKNKLRFPHHRY
jgi:hypothetical protein